MQPTPAINKYIVPLFTKTQDHPCIYILAIDLLGAPLAITRTIHIPSNMNLGYVQEVLMLAMGWEGNHLKEIRYGGITYFTRMASGEDPEEIEGFPQRDSFKYTLGDLMKLPGDTFTFIYDFGDSWRHHVTLIDIEPIQYDQADSDYAGAHLISGQNACPPEDVGGVDGYAEMLKALAEPKSKERKEYIKWLGRDFDPQAFDLYATQCRVKDFQRIIGEARWGFYHI